MTKLEFNPNEIGVANGNFFALPCTIDTADLILISVPWDATTSYKPGTSAGPEAILEASIQVDLFDFHLPQAWEMKLMNEPIFAKKENKKARAAAEQVIEHLEQGGQVSDEAIALQLAEVNTASEWLNNKVYEAAKKALDAGKVAAVVGGEHSVPYGLIKAVAEKYSGVGILHIDAHADLRQAYEGFTYSHASIMYNVINDIPQVNKLVQVGIRDLCENEFELAVNNKKIVMYPDEVLKSAYFAGKNWHDQCADIIAQLPVNVYISFDIDGLDPALCPNTGTPVPGGLSFEQACYLLRMLALSGRKIVGFDLNETAPGTSDDWDANVAARLLFKLCCAFYLSRN